MTSMLNINVVIFSGKNLSLFVVIIQFECLHRCKGNAIGQKYFVKKKKNMWECQDFSFLLLAGLNGSEF